MTYPILLKRISTDTILDKILTPKMRYYDQIPWWHVYDRKAHIFFEM